MPQVSTTIQNLLNGVSQQADSQKFPSQAQEQINGMSSPVVGLSKRNPTEHIAKVFTSAPSTDVWAGALNRDSSERYMVFIRAASKSTVTLDSSTDTVNCVGHSFVAGDEVRFYGADLGDLNQTARFYVINPASGTFQVSTTSGGSAVSMSGNGSGTQSVSLDPIAVFDLINKTEKTVTTTNGAEYLLSSTPATKFKSTSIADYSFIVNTDTTVAMDSAVSSDTRWKAYVYIKQGDYGTDYNVTVDSSELQHTTPDGASASDRDLIATDYIANQLTASITALTGYTATQVGSGSSLGSTIEVVRDDGNDFEITTSDSLGDGAMGVVKYETDAFTNLPMYCRDGKRVKVYGDVEANTDDYYVKFTADSPTNNPFGKGTWAEDIAPLTEYLIDASTFCHTLIRESSGDFTFKQGTWGNRLVGDTTSNPNPSFVGKKIQNIVLFRDRLAFLSGENISMSETGEYFNFFRTTVTQTLGSDPVDIRASHNKVSNLKSAVPFSRNLILFSDKTQFQLTGGDVLTPSTVSISQETEFEVDTTADSTVSGSSIYFPFSRGDYSGVMEYFVSPDTEQMDGQDISAHIPNYISGNITKMVSSSADPTVVITSSGLSNGIYVYRYLYRGRDRVQSSWSKFTFDTGSSVNNVDFVGKDLYVVVKRTDGLFLESLSFKEGDKDSNSEFKTALDRRVKESDCSISYDSNTQLTTIVLPYTSYGTIDVATRADGSSENSGTRFSVNQTGNTNTITVEGDLTSRKLWVGDKYTFTYTLNKPYLKLQNEQGRRSNAASGRFQVRHGIVTYDNSSSFKINVTSDGRSTRTYPFESRLLNTTGFTLGGDLVLKDGTFKFPVKAQGGLVDIQLTNDTPFPSCFLTMEYEATYYSRYRQV